MTISVFLDLRLTPEGVTRAPAMLREILADTRAFEGCEGVDVLIDHQDPTHLILAERWVSTEADAAYRQWRATDGASQLGTLLASAPTSSSFETATNI
jgi:quinol monooxygenase YgiN